MALGLARAGYRVAITAARQRAEIEAVSQEGPRGLIHPFVADVSQARPKPCLILRTARFDVLQALRG